ncbi:MAG TPA: SBBP repeat-containing protein, partial [Verrucomicrobiae bacterium]|nr:SBBP repeat-containing protein [Verrucomicrobiae bacterium]
MKRTSNTLGLIAFCILSAFLPVQAGTAQTIYENYTVTTLAGPDQASPSWQDGSTNVARFGTPFGMAKDAAGNIYVADTLNHTIRKITPTGFVSTVAGFTATPGSADGIGADARFNTPHGIAVDSDGNLYVADTGNHTIRKITPDGTVTTFAGLAGTSGTANGTGNAARFSSPYGVMIGRSNLVFVADTFNNTIRVITPAGVVSTFAGKAGVTGSQDKTGTAATFSKPTALAMDSSGNIYVSDTANDLIRK